MEREEEEEEEEEEETKENFYINENLRLMSAYRKKALF